MLMNTMMIGVIMTICANNWMSMWIGLEISLMSFIPIMQSNKKISSEAMMKYFITQSIASSMFMFGMIYMLIGVNIMNENIMTISMLMKLGSAPFHNWILLMIEVINYFPMLILLTIMKVPPLFILHQINTKMLFLPILIGMTLSAISSLNQSSINKIMGYSSIFNMSFMLTTISKLNVLINFMVIYTMIMTTLILSMKIMKIKFVSQLVLNDWSMWLKMNIWVNMLSLAGFPPLMGFFAKTMVIQNMIIVNEFLLTMLMVITSMIIMMLYTRMAFSSIMSFHTMKKWNLLTKSKMIYFIMSINLTSPVIVLTLSTIS